MWSLQTKVANGTWEQIEPQKICFLHYSVATNDIGFHCHLFKLFCKLIYPRRPGIFSKLCLCIHQSLASIQRCLHHYNMSHLTSKLNQNLASPSEIYSCFSFWRILYQWRVALSGRLPVESTFYHTFSTDMVSVTSYLGIASYLR